jgi:hypothetical protein
MRTSSSKLQFEDAHELIPSNCVDGGRYLTHLLRQRLRTHRALADRTANV